MDRKGSYQTGEVVSMSQTQPMTEYQPRTAERLVEILRAKSENPRSVYREAASEIERVASLKARIEELTEALQSIRQYGTDTLSGRADGPDDREWQREAVREMTRRANDALESKHD
jgi:hypothetical protein